MYCRRCGELLVEGEISCKACGTEVLSIPAENTENIDSKNEMISQDIDVTSPNEEIYSGISHPAVVNERTDSSSSLPKLPNISPHDSKPLYGYEPYNHERYLNQQIQQQQPLQQNQYQDIPIVTAASPYYTGFENARVPGYTPQPHMVPMATTKKPKGNRVGLLIILLSFMFIVVFICLGVIMGRLGDIRSAMYNFTAPNQYNYAEHNYGDGYEDNGETPNEYESTEDNTSYDWLLSEYFLLVSKNDFRSMYKLLHPKVIEALEANGYLTATYAEAIDAFYEYYGSFIESFSIIDIYPYSTSDYAALAEKIGFDQASLEAYIDVYVGVTLKNEGKTENLWYDFDLVKIDNQWYLISVW